MRRATVLRLLPFVLLCLGFAGGDDLSYGQRQAVSRQQRNLSEGERKLDDLVARFERESAEVAGMFVAPAFWRAFLSEAELIGGTCDAIEADLEKNACPAAHADVAPLLAWTREGRERLAGLRAEIAPQLAESERIADPATYPDLDADFERIEEIADAYRPSGFEGMEPDTLQNLVDEFPNVTTFFSQTYAEYKPLIIVTGGAESPLYARYKRAAAPLNDFNARVSAFFQQVQDEYPQRLADAVAMGERAARERNPQFFTGGVAQHVDTARRLVTLACTLLPADDDRREAMWGRIRETEQQLAVVEGELAELILAQARLPADAYRGDDAATLRANVLAEWKKAWPQDAVLGTRMHHEDFQRTVKWTWDAGSSSWVKSDRSVLCMLVVVATSERVASAWPAYVNVDNLTGKTTLGVQTKGGAYVETRVLRANL